MERRIMKGKKEKTRTLFENPPFFVLLNVIYVIFLCSMSMKALCGWVSRYAL